MKHLIAVIRKAKKTLGGLKSFIEVASHLLFYFLPLKFSLYAEI